MKRGLVVLLVSLFVVSFFIFTGCTKRWIISANDHPTRGIMNLETGKSTHYILFPGSVTHEFWSCEEKGNSLVCEKACDGKTDLVCPQSNIMTTNVR